MYILLSITCVLTCLTREHDHIVHSMFTLSRDLYAFSHVVHVCYPRGRQAQVRRGRTRTALPLTAPRHPANPRNYVHKSSEWFYSLARYLVSYIIVIPIISIHTGLLYLFCLFSELNKYVQAIYE